MNNKYPYKPAKLIHHNKDLSKRWYVSYWAWSIENNRLQRVRNYSGINRYHTKSERWDVGMQLVSYINDLLEKGYIIGKDLSRINPDSLKSLTITEAFEHVLLKKKDTVRPTSLKQYKTVVPALKKWLAKNGHEKLKIGKLSRSMIYSFLDSRFSEGSITSNKTYNNYLGTIRAIINYIIDRDHNIFRSNPASKIKMLPTSTRIHAAYSKEQLNAIKNEILKQGDQQLLLFIEFIYYTLARPNEIKSLKVGNIEMENNRIFIPRGMSKNRKSDYVDIYPPLKKSILEAKIMDYPKEYFVFSSSQTPGKKKSYVKYFWRKHIKILRALDLDNSDREYTLYSYKHSGVINLYLCGLEPIDIQKQCRHQTLQQTMDYLRELDLFRKTDHFSKVQGF